ncbi:ATP-binding protein [Rhodoferax sp. GW822-FHT02A01]|uniref:sensor histidine kinase n=1 Tax=Rhodoferax sp. GW822-FHT02A01 TaxID=3141537 RepID=UPI00315C5400
MNTKIVPGKDWLNEPDERKLSSSSTAFHIQALVFRTLIDIMPDRIYAKDTQSRFILANKAVANLMGKRTPEEMIGKTDFDFYPVELATEYFSIEQKLIRSGEPLIACEQQVPNLNTGEIGWLQTTKVHLRDAEGNVIGLLGLARDITERKRIEAELLSRNNELTCLNEKLSQAQEQLIQSEKMASIGQLAAGVAHEINNPIGYISSNFGMLESYQSSLFEMLLAYQAHETSVNDDEKTRELRDLRKRLEIDFLVQDVPDLMRESRDGIERVRKIVQDLKNFSHVDSQLDWHASDLRQGIDSTLNVVNNEIKYHADIIKEYGEIPLVECVQSEINQVVMNLVINASHAINRERGKIYIRTGSDGNQVWIEVEDTGCGIPKEILPRIFDPFYTTKPVGKGTGLGLSLSYGIVQKHHGNIEVQTEVGKGTLFRVTLPVKQSKPLAESALQ